MNRPATPGRPRITSPEWTAGPPELGDERRGRSPRRAARRRARVRSRSAIWFAIVAVGRNTASSCPSSSAHAPLQLVDGRVLALLLVADDRPRRSPRACPASGASPCRSGGRSRGADATLTRVDLTLLEQTLARARRARLPRRPGVGLGRARRVGLRRDDEPPARAPRGARRTPCPSRRSRSRRGASRADGTVKTLFRTRDGHPVEAVLMRYRDGRRSICVSSQSGCPLTCTFCATGAMSSAAT